MRDKKALRELLTLDRETLGMMSPKPFKPRTLDVIVSMYAPQLYSEENLAEIKKFSKLEQEHFSHVVPRKARNKRVIGKRCSQSEDMVEEEVINPVNKKPRKTKMSKNATPSSSSSSSSSPPTDAPSSSVSSPPELSEGFKNHIRELNGTDTKFLMHKTLSNTDVEPNNNRLSMPIKKIECEFLTQAEKGMLDERDGKKLVGLEVMVIDPCLAF